MAHVKASGQSEAGRREARGRVDGIYTATAAGELMESRESVDTEAGVGIVGDRYATKRGYYSDPKWPDQEITLVEAEAGEAVGMPAGLLRRNIVMRGARLDDLIGREFRMGTTVLLGVRRCDPCSYLEGLTRPGLVRALAGRGGLRAKVLRGGRISVGDAVVIEENAGGRADLATRKGERGPSKPRDLSP